MRIHVPWAQVLEGPHAQELLELLQVREVQSGLRRPGTMIRVREGPAGQPQGHGTSEVSYTHWKLMKRQ